MNFLAILSLFSKISTVLTASQQIASLLLKAASADATALGKTDTAKHLDVVSDAVHRDAALADAVVHLLQVGAITAVPAIQAAQVALTTTTTPNVQPVVVPVPVVNESTVG